MRPGYHRSLLRLDVVGVLTLAGVAWATWWLGYRPGRADAREAQAQRRELEQVEAALVAARSTLRQTAERLRTAEGEAADVPSLPALSGLNAELGELTARSNRLGLTFDSVRPGRPTLMSHHAEVPLQLAGRGGLVGVVKLLKELSGPGSTLVLDAMTIEAIAGTVADAPPDADPGSDAATRQAGSLRFELRLRWLASAGSGA